MCFDIHLRRFLITWSLFLILLSESQPSAQTMTTLNIPAYIEKFSDVAVRHMVEYGIPASITLAQGILESAAGTSELATQANNHFGIKCHDWHGDTYTYDDDSKGECFRKYKDAVESYEDHALFLTKRPRYAGLFSLDKMDYKAWARGLKVAGYATLPLYAEKLVGYIEKYQLFKYDSIAWKMLKNQQTAGDNKTETNTSVAPSQTAASEASAGLQKTETAHRISVQKMEERRDDLHKTQPRKVEMYNGLRAVYARPGDTQASLAREFEMAEWQIRRYNDLQHGEIPAPGSLIYLEARYEQHPHLEKVSTEQEENWRRLADRYGLKLEALKKLNPQVEEPIPPGVEIILRRL